MTRVRTWLLALTLGLVAPTLAACGSDGDSDDAGNSEGFPVTIEHAHGEATIESKPERVVTIGWITQDIVAALGVVPVGIPESWGGDDEGFTPWFRDQVAELDGEMPEILEFDGEGAPDYEQILALEPDVILAPHSGITEVQYERLDEIAPTVAYAEQPWFSGSWDDLTLEIGEALGRTDEAEEVIAQTQSSIDEAAAGAPNLEGTSFAYGGTVAEGDSEMGIYVSEDPRVAFLREFGLVDSPSLDTLGEGFSNFVGALSLEQMDTLEADLYVAWSNGPTETEATLAHPTFSRWAPIVDGDYYFLEDTTLAMATNGPSVLSIPWAIDNGFVDDLSAAVDGGAVVRGATEY